MYVANEGKNKDLQISLKIPWIFSIFHVGILKTNKQTKNKDKRKEISIGIFIFDILFLCSRYLVFAEKSVQKIEMGIFTP